MIAPYFPAILLPIIGIFLPGVAMAILSLIGVFLYGSYSGLGSSL